MTVILHSSRLASAASCNDGEDCRPFFSNIEVVIKTAQAQQVSQLSPGIDPIEADDPTVRLCNTRSRKAYVSFPTLKRQYVRGNTVSTGLL